MDIYISCKDNQFFPSATHYPLLLIKIKKKRKPSFYPLEARFPDFGSNLSTHQKQSIRWKWLLISKKQESGLK